MIPARGKITGRLCELCIGESDANLAGFDEAIMINQDGHIAEDLPRTFLSSGKEKSSLRR